jgi:hypothetical protein
VVIAGRRGWLSDTDGIYVELGDRVLHPWWDVSSVDHDSTQAMLVLAG